MNTPEWLEAIKQRNESLGDYEIPENEAGKMLAKILYSLFEDTSRLLQLVEKQREALEYMANQICGNSELPGDAGHFYRGYNSVIRDHRKKAKEALLFKPEGVEA